MANATVELTDPVTVGRRLRVFLPEDLEQSGQPPAMIINVGSSGTTFSTSKLIKNLNVLLVCKRTL